MNTKWTFVLKVLNIQEENMRCVLERFHNDLKLLNNPTKTLKSEGFYKTNKVRYAWLFYTSPVCAYRTHFIGTYIAWVASLSALYDCFSYFDRNISLKRGAVVMVPLGKAHFLGLFTQGSWINELLPWYNWNNVENGIKPKWTNCPWSG